MVQRVLNAACRVRIPPTSFWVVMGRAPPSAMSVLASNGRYRWNVHRLDEDRIREMKGLVKRQEALHEDVVWRVAAERRRSREVNSEKSAHHV